MLTILALAVLSVAIITVITPTQSRLGTHLMAEHKMVSSAVQDPVSGDERLSSEDSVPSMVGPPPKHQKRQARFSSIDFFNGNISVAARGYTIPSHFSVDHSTEENYSSNDMEFYGSYEAVRSTLDYSYHGNYTKSRQLFQDKIITKLLDDAIVQDSKNGISCRTPTEPWIVFTAGVMGAGKSHTMKRLASQGYFPLKSFVIVDPDDIRQQFPEFHLYASRSKEKAGERTHKEAGYVTEITTSVALNRGYNVLVDGSLRDWEWYIAYFKMLKREYRHLRVAILYISAPREKIFERAKKRAAKTGRVVPTKTLEASLEQVPISIEKLSPIVDYFCELDNSMDSGEITIKTAGITWQDFHDNWLQSCPWPGPTQAGKM